MEVAESRAGGGEAVAVAGDRAPGEVESAARTAGDDLHAGGVAIDRLVADRRAEGGHRGVGVGVEQGDHPVERLGGNLGLVALEVDDDPGVGQGGGDLGDAVGAARVVGVGSRRTRRRSGGRRRRSAGRRSRRSRGRAASRGCAASTTCWIKGRPVSERRGLPGRRVEAYRAGITATISIFRATFLGKPADTRGTSTCAPNAGRSVGCLTIAVPAVSTRRPDGHSAGVRPSPVAARDVGSGGAASSLCRAACPAKPAGCIPKRLGDRQARPATLRPPEGPCGWWLSGRRGGPQPGSRQAPWQPGPGPPFFASTAPRTSGPDGAGPPSATGKPGPMIGPQGPDRAMDGGRSPRFAGR